MNDEIIRLLDANFNRAREALRVMEDYARFILNDAHLNWIAKQLRHDLAELKVPPGLLCAKRDIIGDVGTHITTPREMQRADETAVVTAACKRLTEALRCLEEYLKCYSATLPEKIEKFRYRAYNLEKLLMQKIALRGEFQDVRLYVLLTEKYCTLSLLETVQALIQGGADGIQLREKDMPDQLLLETANEIGQLCWEHDVRFLLNDRADIAAISPAVGLHLGQNDLPVAQARKILHSAAIIGKSTHSIAEARAASMENPDYIAAGSIFGSPTKPEVTVAGTQLLTEIRQFYSGSLLAIGGITADNAGEAIAAGASGVAVCQAVISSDDPAIAAARIKEEVSKQVNDLTH